MNIVRPALRRDLDPPAAESPVLRIVAVRHHLNVSTESSLGVITVVPPHTALSVLIPSMLYPVVFKLPPIVFADAPFSVAKMPLECPIAAPPDGPDWFPAAYTPPPPAPCAPSAEHSRRQSQQAQRIPLVHRHVLHGPSEIATPWFAVSVASPTPSTRFTVTVCVAPPAPSPR